MRVRNRINYLDCRRLPRTIRNKLAIALAAGTGSHASAEAFLWLDKTSDDRSVPPTAHGAIEPAWRRTRTIRLGLTRCGPICISRTKNRNAIGNDMPSFRAGIRLQYRGRGVVTTTKATPTARPKTALIKPRMRPYCVVTRRAVPHR